MPAPRYNTNFLLAERRGLIIESGSRYVSDFRRGRSHFAHGEIDKDAIGLWLVKTMHTIRDSDILAKEGFGSQLPFSGRQERHRERGHKLVSKPSALIDPWGRTSPPRPREKQPMACPKTAS